LSHWKRCWGLFRVPCSHWLNLHIGTQTLMGGLQLLVAEGNMAILHSSNFTGLDGQFWELRNCQKPFKNRRLSKFL
jgi:hypothetical protein